MLHYADVSEIDLNNIVDNKLKITINGDEYEITGCHNILKQCKIFRGLVLFKMY